MVPGHRLCERRCGRLLRFGSAIARVAATPFGTGDRGPPIPHWGWRDLCAAFSPDGRFVVTGSTDSLGRVWEAATGRLVGRPLPHQNWVRAVAFAPDNRRVLTGSHDMTARVWD